MSDARTDAKIDVKTDARTGEVRSESWIEAGLEEIARTGLEGVRVEVLAKSLGVTVPPRLLFTADEVIE